jgi:hypothetical protein
MAARKKTKPKRKTTVVAALIEALPEDLRDFVVERASIIFESGTAWEEAERLAYEMETGRTLDGAGLGGPGVARAKERDDSAVEAEPAPKTTRSRSR